MKKKIRITLIILSISLILLQTMCFASNIKRIKKIVNANEESNFVNSIQNEITENETIYKFISHSKQDDKNNTKIKSYTSDVKELKSKDVETLEKEFAKTYNYKDEEYEGVLNFKEYKIETIDNGYYEKIETKKVELKDYTTNDLNAVEKEKKIDGANYVLIDVEWAIATYDEVENKKVPKTYNAIANYSRKVRIANPDTYRVSAVYEGTVNKINKVYHYTLNYEEQVKEEKINVIPFVMTAGGIIILIGLVMLTKTNATVYQIVDSKETKLKNVRVKANKNIDLSRCGVKSNNIILKLSNSAYSKLEGKEISLSISSYQKLKRVVSNNRIHFSF